MIYKKALSPVIATSLLVVLVITLSVIIFFAARSWFSEQLEKNVGGNTQPVEEVCKQIEFEIEPVLLSGTGVDVEIANYGNIPIHSFDIRKTDDKGNTEMTPLEISLNVGGTIEERIIFKNTSQFHTTKVTIFPKVLATIRGGDSNKAFTCLDIGKTINI